MKKGKFPMRVLFWSGTFWPNIGGVEVLAAKLLPALQERGYEFRVVTVLRSPDLPREACYEGIPVYRFPFSLAHNNVDQVLEIRQQIAKLKRTFAPDLVHINAVDVSNFFHLTTVNAHLAPFLVTLHGEWQKEADSIVKHTLQNAAWITGCSAAILLRGQQLVPEIISRSSVIYNALRAPALLPGPLPIRAPRMLCLGRLVFEKGFDSALTAFASIVERFPQVRLVIAGDGPARTSLAQQAAKLGLTNVVDFVGWVAPDKVPALINTATIVVIPSRCAEAFGLVALEAALMARPVVATRIGGLHEVVAHRQTGLLVENEDSKALAEAVAFLLREPRIAMDLGQAARQRAQELFSFERYVEAYDTLYRRLAGRVEKDRLHE
jgi:glycogen(starch) synthase